MSEEWWTTETEVDAEPGLPVKLPPKDLDEVDKYRMPAVIYGKRC